MTYYFPVLAVLGGVLMIFALAMLVPLAFAFFGHDSAVYSYDEAILITLAVGAPAGRHTACLYAINPSRGLTTALGCQTTNRSARPRPAASR